ncbi:MAG: VOC family protein [Elusimicrobia bacterium]|nr:VOC family protein [Elusimicrobiota bacterium]
MNTELEAEIRSLFPQPRRAIACLATVDAERGFAPEARPVTLLEVGWRFYVATGSGTRKARELAAHPKTAALVRAILNALSLCCVLAVSTRAEEPMVTGLLPVVVTDDVERLKVFYRDVVGLPVQADEGDYVQFGAGQSHLSIIARGVIGRIAGERGRIRPGDKGFRFELYFRVSDAQAAAARLRKSGAVLVSALSPRPWGDRTAYFLDPDENLVAVAEPAIDGKPN